MQHHKESPDTVDAVLNPQQQICQKQPTDQISNTNKVKFRYRIIEKPKTSFLSIILIISWAIVILMLLGASFFNRLKLLETEASQQQVQCKLDYQKNKCQRGLKATAQYCQHKRKCFQSDTKTFYQSKINISYIAGEIIKGFVQGAGLYVCLGGLLMIWTIIKTAPARQVMRQYIQYFR